MRGVGVVGGTAVQEWAAPELFCWARRVAPSTLTNCVKIKLPKKDATKHSKWYQKWSKHNCPLTVLIKIKLPIKGATKHSKWQLVGHHNTDTWRELEAFPDQVSTLNWSILVNLQNVGKGRTLNSKNVVRHILRFSCRWHLGRGDQQKCTQFSSFWTSFWSMLILWVPPLDPFWSIWESFWIN